MDWEFTGQHDNGGLVYYNKHDLLFIEMHPEKGTVAFYCKRDIEEYKQNIDIEDLMEITYDDSSLINYIFQRNDWSDHCNSIEIVKIISNLLI